MVAKYGGVAPFVDVGGLERPCVARYETTIDRMADLRSIPHAEALPEYRDLADYAQRSRYLDIFRPLEASCPGYVCENPATGGLSIERLSEKYGSAENGTGSIGTAILLSVLEHVANPFECARALRTAMQTDGLAIVSVPFMFPEHKSPRDLWRFTPDALREVFCEQAGWRVEWADWRLRIGADSGVLDIHTMRPQAIESCACVARAI